VFYFGGGVVNIYQRVNAVMKDCEYLQKKQAQQGKGIKYDEVIAMVRDLLIKHGVVLEIRQKSFENASGVEGTKQKIYQGYYEMDLVNMDMTEERIKHTAYGVGVAVYWPKTSMDAVFFEKKPNLIKMRYCQIKLMFKCFFRAIF